MSALPQQVCLCISVAGASLAATAYAADVTSVYGDAGLAGCETLLDADPPVSQRAVWEDLGAVRHVCPGSAGFEVQFIGGDTLIGVGYAPETRRDAEFPLEVFDEYAVASRDKIEWRMKGERPVAVIHRWFIDRGGAQAGNPEDGNVLVVSKVTGEHAPASCVVGYVDAKANPGANGLAREVADTVAPAFACGEDVPQFHGEVGPTAAERVVLN